jgi:hypothetical protein
VLKVAENPLDLAKHHGWITPTQHQHGEAFAALYRRAGVDLPRLRIQDLARAAHGHSEAIGSPEAMEMLRKCAKLLDPWPKPAQALFDFCVMQAWPTWIISRYQGVMNPAHELGRANLLMGLQMIGQALSGSDRPSQTLPLAKSA